MTRKLKVVVNAIPAANPVTGIGRYVLELYSAIQEIAGGELDIRFFDGRRLCALAPHGPKDMKRFSWLGNLFWSLPNAVSFPIRLGVHHAREWVFRGATEGADIYHETAFFPFRPADGVRIVQTVHDLSLHFHPEWHPAERVSYWRRYFPERLQWASRILCISEFTRSELIRFDPRAAERISVSPLAAAPAFRPAPEEARRRVRDRYGLPEKYLLFVGSGDPRKNFRAVEEVISRGRVPCRVVCAGWEGWMARSDRENAAMMIGYVPDADLPALYSEAVAFVFPSLYEGFGLPVLEAMACGCPVVVPRAHSMPELAGAAGMYFGSPTDVDQLERCLTEIVERKSVRDDLSAAGLQRARSFDWKETARATLEAFERSLAASNATARPR